MAKKALKKLSEDSIGLGIAGISLSSLADIDESAAKSMDKISKSFPAIGSAIGGFATLGILKESMPKKRKRR